VGSAIIREVLVFGLRRRNRTTGWVARPGTVLTLDLDTFTLGGAAIGDHADSLARLGPGEPGIMAREYHFPAHDITLDLDGDRLSGFHVHFPDFPGVVRFRDRTVPVDTLDGRAACVARFGEPDVVEDDVLTYLPDGREWEVLLENGRVMMISVY
jgi:hypothetical protein